MKSVVLTVLSVKISDIAVSVSTPEVSVFAVLSLQCVSAGMDTLTLARFYCEMSLMEMEMVSERGSLLASACLLLALVTKDLGGWVGPLHTLNLISSAPLFLVQKVQG